MQKTVNVLWVDDDSPQVLLQTPGFVVDTVKSCKAAVDMIESKAHRPDWIVVDLILPQDRWGEAYVLMPGLELLKYFKSKYRAEVGLLAFSVVMTDAVRSMAMEAGAEDAFAKTSQSWRQVLETIKVLQTQKMNGGVDACQSAKD